MWRLVLQSLIFGILMGGIYASLGVGFTLTWGVTKILNISHCTFAVLAAYIAYWLLVLFGVDPLVSLAIVVPTFFAMGLAVYIGLIRSLFKAKDITMASMVFTVGLATVLENLMLYMWSPDPRVMITPYTGRSIFLGDMAVPITALMCFLVSIGTVLGVYLFLHKTYVGKAVRATWQNPELASLYGIDKEKVTMITFGLAMVSAGVGGVCLALISSFYPSIHNIWTIHLFLVVIIGGVGSVVGAAVGGIIVGLLNALCGIFIPYSWLPVVSFSTLIVLLLIRPRGLFRA